MIELVIDRTGTANCIYTDDLDLAQLGEVQVRRASHCEPDQHGRWWADLSPVAGPKLGPYTLRRAALAAEACWLRQHWLGCPAAHESK
jgi:hypothetical protein